MAARLFLHTGFILLALSISAFAQPQPTTTTVESLRNPSLVGQAVTFRATLSASGGGTVTFKSGSTVLGEVTSFGTFFPPDVVTFTTSALTEGSHSITAEFGGNAFELSSTSAPITQTVNPMGTTRSTTVVTSSLNPSRFGQPVTFTATVSGGVGGLAPTGEVVFRRGGIALGPAQPLNKGAATITTQNLNPGENLITADYDGDPTYEPSTSNQFSQFVDPGLTETQLTSSENPTQERESVTFTATISNPDNFLPSGTVTFRDGGVELAAVAIEDTTFGPAQARYMTTTLAIGAHPITARYNGSSFFEPSDSNTVLQGVTRIGVGPTTTIGSSSPNPSTFGAVITLTAMVTSPNGTPTGEVDFMEGTTLLGSANLTSGAASIQTILAVGDHNIVAKYLGDIDFAPSDSTPFPHTVNRGLTTTSLTTSPNPSAIGALVTLTAEITAGGYVPSGTVTFKDGSTTLGSSEIQLGTFGPGIATFTTSTLAAGAHSLTAEYAGDASFEPSNSPAFTHRVTDPNGDGGINIVDVFYIVNRIFHGGPAPVGEQAMDANGDGTLNAADIIYLLDYLF